MYYKSNVVKYCLFGMFFMYILGCVDSGVSNKKREVEFSLKDKDEIVLCGDEQSFSVKKNSNSIPLPALSTCLSPKGRFISYNLKTPPSKGLVTSCMGLEGSDGDGVIVLNDRTCLYTPLEDYTGEDLFVYEANDGHENSAQITVRVNVTENHSPKMIDQTFTLIEKSAIQSLGELEPAVDEDIGDSLNYSIETLPQYGILSDCLGLNGSDRDDLSCNFKLQEETESDLFQIKAIDQDGESTDAVVTLLFNDITPPTVLDTTIESYVKMNGGKQTLKVDNTLASDLSLNIGLDPLDPSLSYQIYSYPIQGSLSSCLGLTGSYSPLPDLTCEYTPSEDFKGEDSFSYLVLDDDGNSTTVIVDVHVINNAPFGEDFIVSFSEVAVTQSFDLGLGTYLGDSDGDLDSIVGVYPLNSEGEFDGVLTYGTLTNCLGLSGSSSSTDVTCDFLPSGLAVNAVEEDFKYKMIDSSSDSSTYSVTIKIRNINNGPAMSNQSFNLLENGGAQPFTLSPASDVDNVASELTYSIISYPLIGSIDNCLGEDGSSSKDLSCHYTPPANQYGIPFTSFVVRVSDGILWSDATITLNVLNMNRSPVFSERSTTLTVSENSTGMALATALATLPDAVDGDVGDTLTYSVLTAPLGTLSNCLNSNQDLDCDYLPPVGLSGTQADRFVVKVVDDEGASDQLIVYLTITAGNSVPNIVALSQSKDVNEDPGIEQTLTTVDAGADIDPDDVLSYSLKIAPKKGLLKNCLGLNGSLPTDRDCTYTIDPIKYPVTSDIVMNSFDNFTYQVSDGKGGYDSSRVYINVLAKNQPPTIASIDDESVVKNSFVGLSTYIDEGGGSDEDIQTLQITVTSSDQTVVRDQDIYIYYGSDRSEALSNLLGVGGSVRAVGDGVNSGDDKKLYLDLIPIYAGVSDGTSTITITLADSLNPATTVTETFVLTVKNISVAHGGWSKILANGPTVLRDSSYITGSNDSQVILKWEDPTITSSTSLTVTGWNLYRNGEGSSDEYFDYTSPVNGSTPIASNSYTDAQSTIQVDASDSNGKVFWYKLRPILSNGVESEMSAALDRTIRVIVPPPNMSLVNRLMANKDICTQIGETPNSGSNYSCTYVGPGNQVTEIFDLGYDLLVDRFGIGCPYTTDQCSYWYQFGGIRIEYGPTDCITPSLFGNPSYAMSRAYIEGDSVGDIYYDRQDGKCYIYGGGDASLGLAVWTDLDSYYVGNGNFASVDDVHPNYPQLPGLTSLQQENAFEFCTNGDQNSFDIEYDDGSVYKSVNRRMLTKKEFTVAASWSDSYSNAEVSLLETGTSLNSYSRCNSIDGQGLTFDSSQVSTETSPSFGDPGTKAVWNGSESTASCQSRYGLQDMVGNYGEWTSDQFQCTSGPILCQGLVGSLEATNTDFSINSASAPGGVYSLDDTMGPCDLDGSADDCFDDSFILGSQSSVTKIFLPLGLPILTSYSEIAYSLLTIGTSSGQISSGRLHNDRITIYQQEVDGVAGDIGGVIVGGSYNSQGDSAGIYSFQVRKKNLLSRDVSFRCAVPVDY